VKYKTITIRVELSGEEKALLNTVTDIELKVIKKINRVIWWRRLFGKKSKINLDKLSINQFPNN
jgi:hypothetical protein